jgi:hypothetical protein
LSDQAKVIDIDTYKPKKSLIDYVFWEKTIKQELNDSKGKIKTIIRDPISKPIIRAEDTFIEEINTVG